jgi:hypothetical protein
MILEDLLDIITRTLGNRSFMIGSVHPTLNMISDPGRKYYLLDAEQFVVWTGKPHGPNGNVNVCSLGDGHVFDVDYRRMRQVIQIRA